MSAVEANACGNTAVICSKNGGFLEYIEDKVNGYFVDENDVINSIRNIVLKKIIIFLIKIQCNDQTKVKYLEYSQFKKKLLNLLYQPVTLIEKLWDSMVGATGFEPVTPAVSRQCSTAELRTLSKDFFFYFPRCQNIVKLGRLYGKF